MDEKDSLNKYSQYIIGTEHLLGKEDKTPAAMLLP